ncbi:MAG: GAF domain-containing protein [Planctomycetaceae bacterium]|nr:GAF domain-containing protein [Planctomycetaceae bacterium]
MKPDFFEQHLKEFPPEPSPVEQSSTPMFSALPEIIQSFQKVTGYQLKFAKSGMSLPECFVTFPVSSLKDQSPYLLGLARNLTSMSLIPERDVEYLARSLADLLSEAHSWQTALRQREAELAANVQLTFHNQKHFGLAKQLESLLQHGAKAVHCDAASLYLLDHETSLLKLRSIWGLPEERLTDPPRELCTALADLEAMLGHAVVLNDGFLNERWNTPEIFTSAVCIPVASSTTIHGTLWFYSNAYCDFDQSALEHLEIIAGRIALELERKMLLREGHDGMILKRQLIDSEHFLQNQLPSPVIKPNDWQLAGTTLYSKPLAATFYDWQSLTPNQTLLTLVSTAENVPSIESQMRMVMLQAEIRNIGRRQPSIKQTVREMEDLAFSRRAEKKPFEMLFGVLDKRKMQLRLSCSGAFVLFRFASRKNDPQHRLILRRIDSDFVEIKPELSGFRMLRLQKEEGVVAIHLPLESHHHNVRILDALFSKSFLLKTAAAKLGENALQIAEFFGTYLQQQITGTNITVLVLKND